MRKFKHISIPELTAIFNEENNRYYCKLMGENICLIKQLVENSKDWVEIFEPKFKNGDIIKHKTGTAILLITDFENKCAYGVDNEEWTIGADWDFKNRYEDWQLATKEEWLEALTKEAENRGFKEGKDLKVNFKYCNYIGFIPNHSLADYGFKWHSGVQEFSLNGCVVLKKDIWAEIIKEEMLEELTKRYVDYYRNEKGNMRETLFNFFNENKEIIHRLSK